MTPLSITDIDRAILQANPQLAVASWAAVERYCRVAAVLGLFAIALALTAPHVRPDVSNQVRIVAWEIIILQVAACFRLRAVSKRLRAGQVVVAYQCVPPRVLLDASALRSDFTLRPGLSVSPNGRQGHWWAVVLAALSVVSLYTLSDAGPGALVLRMALLLLFFTGALRAAIGIYPVSAEKGESSDDTARAAAIRWLEKRVVRLHKQARKARRRGQTP